MRITFAGQFRDAAISIERASERLADYQRQVSSGRRMDRVSDDPAATTAALGERGKLAQNDQYSRTTDSAYSRLTIVDTALSDIVTKLTAAQVAGNSALGSSVTDTQRAAAAQQLAGLKQAVVDDFNTSFQGSFVFAGTKSTTRPYAVGAGGVVAPYAGGLTPVQVDIDEGRAVTIGFDGNAIAKGSDPDDVFTTFDNLIAAVNAGDGTGILSGLAALTNVFARVTAAQSGVGGSMQALDSEKVRLSATKLATKDRLSKLEDANMADAITGMQQADTAYKAALGATASMAKLSLMDYL